MLQHTHTVSHFLSHSLFFLSSLQRFWTGKHSTRSCQHSLSSSFIKLGGMSVPPLFLCRFWTGTHSTPAPASTALPRCVHLMWLFLCVQQWALLRQSQLCLPWCGAVPFHCLLLCESWCGHSCACFNECSCYPVRCSFIMSMLEWSICCNKDQLKMLIHLHSEKNECFLLHTFCITMCVSKFLRTAVCISK